MKTKRYIKSIKQWQKEVHALAKEKGWHETSREIPELLCLLHSEISEALEAYREKKGYKVPVAEELADVAIRLFDMCEYLGIDLEYYINKKHEINKLRPYRHGNKRC